MIPEAAQRSDQAVRQATRTADSAASARASEQRTALTAAALDTLATCLDVQGAQAAAMACVTELSTRLRCERVSYGRFDRGRRLRLVAMSNNARVAERSNLVRAIEAAMNEAVEQDRHVVLPAIDDLVTADRDHSALSRLAGGASVLTVPVAYEGGVIGALTLERPAGESFDADAVDQATTLATVTGPLLELKFRDDEPLHTRARTAVRGLGRKLLGPRHAGVKFILIAIAAAVATLSVVSGTHRVTAQARLEGSIHRAVVAPIDGFVQSAEVRAGDRVDADQLMSRLDDRELKVELSKWQSEAAQLEKQYRGARAAHDRAETAIVSAQRARAAAQIQLIESQLARTELRAPFAGIVVNGDLTQLLGSPVTRGDVLFEIAPLDDYRVVLEVDERDVAYLSEGQTGRMALEGLPGDALPVRVTNITPVARAGDGRNYFRVEASVQGDVSRLRPGMSGIARVDTGEARLIWIWTHSVVEWLRLRLWAWLP